MRFWITTLLETIPFLVMAAALWTLLEVLAA
jgi:hypothetical protein